jgi:hypothetical protein
LTISDDIGNEINTFDNVDWHGINNDITNSDNDNVNKDCPNGADSVFVNQVEEWEEAIDNKDDSISDSLCYGNKHPHLSTLAVSAYQWCKPVKVYIITGEKPKAGDYEVTIQKVLSEMISLYCGYLSMVNLYPGPIEQIKWVKKS